MAKNGLDATNYRAWIDHNIVIDDFTKELFEEFVLGTPAFGLSKKGRNLYDYYGYKTTEDYISLKSSLINEIPLNVFDTYEKLKNAFLKDSTVSFLELNKIILSETIYMYIGTPSDSKFYKEYFEPITSAKGKTRETQKQESDEKKNIVAMEKLFYHLRNGLAHGCYTIVEQNNERYYIIQDEGKNMQLSARMILKSSTLRLWISVLRKRKESIDSHMSGIQNKPHSDDAEKIA